MKMYFIKSHTTVVDMLMVFAVGTIYLGGFFEFLLKKLSISIDAKLVEMSAHDVWGSLLVVFSFFIVMVVAIYIGRWVCARIFNIKTGDSFVEVDLKNGNAKEKEEKK